MTKTTEIDHESGGKARPGADASEVQAWFVREVLPLEAALMQFLRRRRHNASDVDDLRHDVYVRVCEAAQKEIPWPVRPFVFAVARNLMIDHARRDHVVPIDAVADLDALNVASDMPGPESSTIAREELRTLQDALDHLPARCREAVVMRKIEGLPRREIAVRMGIAEKTVRRHIGDGMCALADALYSGPAQGRGRS
jgi:RNA polymerase sigma factor (sigma-70 family)